MHQLVSKLDNLNTNYGPSKLATITGRNLKKTSTYIYSPRFFFLENGLLGRLLSGGHNFNFVALDKASHMTCINQSYGGGKVTLHSTHSGSPAQSLDCHHRTLE